MPLQSEISHKEPFSIPATHLVWNLYGAGYDKFGQIGKPERVPTPQPGPDQLLVRIDCVGICYSDIKLLNQGENHPKLKGMNLSVRPTRPGHEISFTVVLVGDKLQDQFQIGERYAIQPEVVHQENKLTYGFSLPGGLTQYQLIGPELLNTDKGISILKIDETLGYAEACLLEPWGSVLSTYDNTRRLVPKQDGKMWIIGNPQDPTDYIFSEYLDFPETIYISDLNPELEERIIKTAKNVQKRDQIKIGQYKSFICETDPTLKFDDIVVVEPQSAEQIELLISLINPGGLINLVGTKPLAKKVQLDAQRIHYDFVSLVGNSGNDLATSYGVKRNRSDLFQNGTAILYGAGGPIGQMHLQRAITSSEGPDNLIVVDVSQERLDYVEQRFGQLAIKNNKTLDLINPVTCGENFDQQIKEITGREVADDVIVMVPNPDVLEQAGSLLHKYSLLNLFAGTPSGTFFPIDISNIYLGNLQITGSSGLSFQHIRAAYDLSRNGIININTSVAAVGGMGVAQEAILAVEERRVPGRVVIYPQLVDLPLMSIEELGNKYPAISPAIGEGNLWTNEAEKILMEIEK